MQNIERRIAALENQTQSIPQWVWRNAKETQAQALERAGLSQSDNVLVFKWLDADKGNDHADN